MDDNLFPTDISLYAIWDSKLMDFIASEDDYFANFVNDEDMLKLMNEGRCVVWSSGSDGNFKIEVRISDELKERESQMVHKKSLNNKLKVEDRVFVGSPEWVGYKEEDGLEKGHIKEVKGVGKGIYSVDIYCLLRVEEGGRKFIDYVVFLDEVEKDHKFSRVGALPQLKYS